RVSVPFWFATVSDVSVVALSTLTVLCPCRANRNAVCSSGALPGTETAGSACATARVCTIPPAIADARRVGAHLGLDRETRAFVATPGSPLLGAPHRARGIRR